MVDQGHIAQSLAERVEDYTLPQPFYLSPEFHKADVKAVFETQWLFACNASELKNAGDYITLEVGENPIVVVRDKDNEVRAFHNTCRHRGAIICNKERGNAARLICPYHQWVYELDGSLRNARWYPKDFDLSKHSLASVHARNIYGMVYICLAETPPDIDRYADAIRPYVEPLQLERTKIAYEETIIEEANWKLVIENNRECYHCAGNHPELLISMFEFALPDDPLSTSKYQKLIEGKIAHWESLGLPHLPVDGGDEFRCLRLPFHENVLSFTLDGGQACKKLLGNFTDPDLGSLRVFRAPNNWNHFIADHAIHFRILPISENRTALRTTWMVHEDAVEGVDYDVDRLKEVWSATNGQDAALAEGNHSGVRSIAYKPGPYAPSEFMLKQFTNWYIGKMEAYLHSLSDNNFSHQELTESTIQG